MNGNLILQFIEEKNTMKKEIASAETVQSTVDFKGQKGSTIHRLEANIKKKENGKVITQDYKDDSNKQSELDENEQRQKRLKLCRKVSRSRQVLINDNIRHEEVGNVNKRLACLNPREVKELINILMLVASVGLLTVVSPMALHTQHMNEVHTYDILFTKLCSRINFNRSQSCQTNDFQLHDTIKHCGFQALCKPESEAKCINTLDGGMAHVCVLRNLSCGAGVWRKAWIDKDNKSIVRTQEEKCPNGKFQSTKSNCFDACQTEHLSTTDLRERFTVHTLGDNKSPTYVYCNYKQGYVNPSNKTFLNYDEDIQHNHYFCRNQSEINLSCVKNEIPLPNGTCVSECRAGECRDDHDDFICKRNCSFNKQSNAPKDDSIDHNKGGKTKPPEIVTEKRSTESPPKDTKLNNDIHIIIICISVVVLGCLIALFIVLVLRNHHCNITRFLPGRDSSSSTDEPRRYNERLEETSKEECKNVTKPLLHGDNGTDEDFKGACSEPSNPSVSNKNGKKGGRLKKGVDDTFTPSVMNSLIISAESCGALIYDGNLVGTVFRVGEKYVMTAFHVVEPFIDQIQNICDKAFVNFADSVCEINCGTYKVKDKFNDKESDVAVLELVDGDQAGILQHSLLLWPSNADDLDIKDMSVVGYGHEKNPYKKHVEKCKILTTYETEKRIHEANKYLQKMEIEFIEDIRSNRGDETSVGRGYSDYNTPHILKFDCFMTKGLSGGPILTNDSNKPKVIGMVIGMRPELFFNLSPAKQYSFPEEFRFEFGIKMETVYIRISSINKNLAEEIFHPTALN